MFKLNQDLYLERVQEAHKFSNENNNTPSEKLVEYFKDIQLGASFDPFHPIFKGVNYTPLEALDFIKNNLKISDIRISIKWNVVDNGPAIKFDAYREVFDYCLKHFNTIVLNVGPIKTMRWPEEHIPGQYEYLIQNGDTITRQHKLADPALYYLARILDFIKSEYGNYLEKFKVLQGDNENYNKFGHFELSFSDDFELAVIDIIHQNFPDAYILINSSGLNDINKIFNLMQQRPNINFIVGINYYYKVPGWNVIPILKDFDNLIIRKSEALAVNDIRKKTYQRNMQESNVDEAHSVVDK